MEEKIGLKSRNAYWDNAKAVLIFLVVLGHYFNTGYLYAGRSGGWWDLPLALDGTIYMFHMPLFAFISGYFSKNLEKSRSKAVRQLLIPYLLLNTLFLIADHFISGSSFYNPLFYPYAHMWYLISLFLWRCFAPELYKLPHSWLWALGLAVLSSVFLPGENWAILGNCLTFFPFFLLGLETGEGTIQRVWRLPRWLCAGVLGLTFCGAAVLMHNFGVETPTLSFLSRTISHDLDGLRQLGIMLLRYALAVVLGVCVLNLIPGKSSRLSALGRNTMTILLFHSLPGLRNLLYWLEPCKNSLVLSLIWWIFWAALMTLVLGSAPVARGYSRVMNAITDRIPRKKG
jgi:fucose 4-O-acetylase-like acetyltransferase